MMGNNNKTLSLYKLFSCFSITTENTKRIN